MIQDLGLLFVLLLGWHFVADYGLQTSYIAENKNKSALVLLAHSSIHGFGVGLLTGHAFLAVLATVVHFFVDDLALRPKEVDQTLHVLTNLLVWVLTVFAATY